MLSMVLQKHEIKLSFNIIDFCYRKLLCVFFNVSISQCLLNTLRAHLIHTFPELIFSNNHTYMCSADHRGNMLHTGLFSFSSTALSMVSFFMTQRTRYCSFTLWHPPFFQLFWEKRKLPVRLVLIIVVHSCVDFGMLNTF